MLKKVLNLGGAFALLFCTDLSANVFKIAFKGDAQGLDLFARFDGVTQHFNMNIYEPLIARDKNMKLVPCLAESWENTEPNVWRLKLRQGVKFHGGEVMSAEDVVFSTLRTKAKSSAIKGSFENIKDAQIVDDLTVDIITHKPDPVLPSILYGFVIMNKAWCEQHGALEPSDASLGKEGYADFHANGTGPFMLKSREPDIKTVLVANPNWWQTPEHNLKEVEFNPIFSDATRMAAILSGKVDLVGQVTLQDRKKIAKRDGLEVMERPGLYSIHMAMDQKSDVLRGDRIKGRENPMKNAKVREAMVTAIDYQALHQKIMRGASHATGLLIGDGIHGYDAVLDKPYAYDLDRAKDLMKEAGFKNGFSLKMACPNDRYVNDEKLCEAVSSMLAKIGVRVNLTTATKSKFFDTILGETGADMYLLGWWPSTYDVYDTYFNLAATPKGSSQGKYNPAGYSNAKVDALLEKIQSEMDPQKRQALIDEMMGTVRADFGHIPLHQEVVMWGKKKNVEVIQRPDDGITFNWVRMNS